VDLGNHEFGYAWTAPDRRGWALRRTDGNQPDFSFLAPGEPRFQPLLVPIREIGPAQMANRDAAVNLTVRTLRHGSEFASPIVPAARVRLEANGKEIAGWKRDLRPGSALS